MIQGNPDASISLRPRGVVLPCLPTRSASALGRNCWPCKTIPAVDVVDICTDNLDMSRVLGYTRLLCFALLKNRVTR